MSVLFTSPLFSGVFSPSPDFLSIRWLSIDLIWIRMIRNKRVVAVVLSGSCFCISWRSTWWKSDEILTSCFNDVTSHLSPDSWRFKDLPPCLGDQLSPLCCLYVNGISPEVDLINIYMTWWLWVIPNFWYFKICTSDSLLMFVLFHFKVVYVI